MTDRSTGTTSGLRIKPRTELVEIQFRGYKALRHFDINLKEMNILVGGNNQGKSTVIGALRILSAGLRRANSSRPTGIYDDVQHTVGWSIGEDSIPVSLENVHTDFGEDATTILFRFSNGNALKLYFPPNGGCSLIPINNGRMIQSTIQFREAFPFKLAVVPVLGPLEHREQLVRKETVQQNLETHRASRNFRNYWFHNPDGFDHFADLIQSSWPGMAVQKPYLENIDPAEVFMFAQEDRMPRELYWCGFGFQIWCQLLTHISRNHDADMLVIDEPEVYLHPDIQRQLLWILRDAGPAITLATHSTEIMAEAEPSELILIDKERNSGRRLVNPREVQAAFLQVGSVHNVSILQAARTRKVLFMEEIADFNILQRFANLLGLNRLTIGKSFAAISSGGYGSWKEIKALPKRIEQVSSETYKIAAVYGRDYRCPEELDATEISLRESLEVAWILKYQEVENYLLNPAVLDRLISTQLAGTGREPVAENKIGCAQILTDITDRNRDRVLAHYIARRKEYLNPRGDIGDIEEESLVRETTAWFESQWRTMDTRLQIVPGKATLSELRSVISEKYKVTFSPTRIAESFMAAELPPEIITLLQRLDAFARS